MAEPRSGGYRRDNQRGSERPPRQPAGGVERGRKTAEPVLPEWANVPQSNFGVINSSNWLHEYLRRDVAVTASTVEQHGNKLRVVIPESGKPVKSSEESPSRGLEGREVLADQIVNYEEHGKMRRITGRFAVDISTVLIIGNRAAIFQGGRGSGALTGPMQQFPEYEASRDIAEQYIVTGSDKTGKRQLIVPKVGGTIESTLVLGAKERAMKGMTEDVVKAIKGNQITETLERERRLESASNTKVVPTLPMLPGFSQFSHSIEVVIGNQVRTIEGFLRYNAETRTVMIMRPVRIDPVKHGIDPRTIEVFDGTGQGRKIKWVEERQDRMQDPLDTLLTGLQKEKKEKELAETMSKQELQTKLLSTRYPVPPSFTAPRATA